MISVTGTGAKWPGEAGARVLLGAGARRSAGDAGEAPVELDARLPSGASTAGSEGGSGAAGINGEHTTVVRKRVMRERIGKVPLDRFSVSL
jgi:hypothetical protein